MSTNRYPHINNTSNDASFAVNKIYSCTQSPKVTLGNCYGYSTMWGLVGDDILLTPDGYFLENIDGKEKIIQDKHSLINNRNNRCLALPLTRAVSSYQLWQMIPDRCDKNLSFHLFSSGLAKLIDEIDKTLSPGETAIIGCHMSIAGHAIAFKKIDNKIEFFDCNRGKFEINNINTFKQWLPQYLKVNYAGAFYAYSSDIVKKQKSNVSIVKNAFCTLGIAICRLITFPIGIPRLLKFASCMLSNFWPKQTPIEEKNKTEIKLNSSHQTLYKTFPQNEVSQSAPTPTLLKNNNTDLSSKKLTPTTDYKQACRYPR